MKAYCAARRLKRNLDPSRRPGFACDDAGIRAAGHDDLLVPRDSADDGGWHTAVDASVPAPGKMHCNNAARGHSADRSRTTHGICGNFAALEHLHQNELVRQDTPLRCQMGLDNSNRSWHGRTIFRMVNPFLGCLLRGLAVVSDKTPRVPPRRDFLTPEMI